MAKSAYIRKEDKVNTLKSECKTAVFYDWQNTFMTLSGEVVSLKTNQKKQTIVAWLDEYAEQYTSKIIIEFKLEYFNVSSSDILLQIFGRLKILRQKTPKLFVRWYYDDLYMAEIGKRYSEMLSIPFEFIWKSSEKIA